MEQLKFIENILSDRIRYYLKKVSSDELKNIQEIRLRLNRNISLTIMDKEYFITENGFLTQSSSQGIKADKNDIETTFNIACQYSLHSFQKELSQGYITVTGGNRIGLCGTAVVKADSVETIKEISSINIRVARQIIGCADDLYSKMFISEINSTLIVGAPASGKTTVIRDLCRHLGQLNRISIIDERNEIAATVNGIPQNDVGACSDIFNSYPKAEAIITAIRVMSPKIIVCDEIGTENDVKALENAVHSGVKIIATAHAGSIEEALTRKGIAQLVEFGAFKNIVLLGTGQNIGRIIKIYRTGEKNAENFRSNSNSDSNQPDRCLQFR